MNNVAISIDPGAVRGCVPPRSRLPVRLHSSLRSLLGRVSVGRRTDEKLTSIIPPGTRWTGTAVVPGGLGAWWDPKSLALEPASGRARQDRGRNHLDKRSGIQDWSCVG